MIRPALASLALLVVTACGGDQGGPSEEPMATVSFLSSPPAYIKTLAVTVTGPGISAPMVFNLTLDSVTHIASGTITVPAGSDRHIVANAFDSLGVNTHRGEITVTLHEGSNPPVNFTMVSLTGSVSIEISFGSSVLLLTPGDTTVMVGDTVSFTFAGTDEHGAQITSPVWGVSNPAVASYVGNGKVVARAEGATTVTVNAGFGAIARTITVGSDTAPSGLSSELLFRSARSGAMKLYSMDSDGSNVQLVPTGSAEVWSAAWSPDRSRVAFAESGEIWVMNRDGSGRLQISIGGCSGTNIDPSFSPDGASVLWGTRYAAACHGVWRANVDGTGISQVIYFREAATPRFSPNGSTIYFSGNTGNSVNLYAMNADGSNLIPLTSDDFHVNEFDLRVSPDGTKVAFTRAADGVQASIFMINADGNGEVPLTTNPGNEVLGGWSPSGDLIAFFNGTLDTDGVMQTLTITGGVVTSFAVDPGTGGLLDWR